MDWIRIPFILFERESLREEFNFSNDQFYVLLVSQDLNGSQESVRVSLSPWSIILFWQMLLSCWSGMLRLILKLTGSFISVNFWTLKN